MAAFGTHSRPTERFESEMGLKRLVKTLTKSREHADTPWTDSMSSHHASPSRSQQHDGNNDTPSSSTGAPQPTVAAFSPNQQTASRTSNRSSIIIHQKSPLLVATPPQVTRTLAYSHPFILPLSHIAGLLSWTTGDPWESFLLVAGFWFTVLYGDDVLRWAGPLVVVVVLIIGMYSRRYSPLSSTVWSGKKKTSHKRTDSEQRKSLDEILDALQTFTSRCDVLLDPFLSLTEFLSTQSSATSATTRPALTTLFVRILTFTPIWILLTLPPLYIITTRRVVLTIGTLALTWHSRPARVTRTIVWRSRTARRASSLLTGLHFAAPSKSSTNAPPPLPPRTKNASTTAIKANGASPGIRFTFTIFENQRRWLGLGWTATMLTYERQAWSDEHLNESPSPEQFELPSTDMPTAKWRWVPKSEWRVEGAVVDKEKSAKRIGGGGGGDDSGWTYYDSKWQDGRKTDGWGRYTRRRKWVRDAELVEITPTTSETAHAEAVTNGTTVPVAEKDTTDGSSMNGSTRSKGGGGWFGGAGSSGGNKKPRKPATDKADVGSVNSAGSTRSRDSPEEDVHTPFRYRQSEWDRSINEGMAPGLS